MTQINLAWLLINASRNALATRYFLRKQKLPCRTACPAYLSAGLGNQDEVSMITYSEIVPTYGLAAKIARCCRITRQAVERWKRQVPARHARMVARLMNREPHEVRPDIYPPPDKHPRIRIELPLGADEDAHDLWNRVEELCQYKLWKMEHLLVGAGRSVLVARALGQQERAAKAARHAEKLRRLSAGLRGELTLKDFEEWNSL